MVGETNRLIEARAPYSQSGTKRTLKVNTCAEWVLVLEHFRTREPLTQLRIGVETLGDNKTRAVQN